MPPLAGLRHVPRSGEEFIRVERNPLPEESPEPEPRPAMVSPPDLASLPSPPSEELSGHNDDIETPASILSVQRFQIVDSSVVGGVSSTIPAGNEPNQSQPEPSFYRFVHAFFMLMTYMLFMLCVVLLTIVGILVILVFCVFPTVLLISLVLCVNYCAGNEPLPLWHLLRYILQGEDPDLSPTPEKARANRALYRPKLIVRKLLHIEDRDENDATPSTIDDNNNNNTCKNDNGDNVLVIYQNKISKSPHSKTIQRMTKLPIEVRTDHTSLSFSAPLEESPKDSDEDKIADKKNGSANENATIDIPSGDAEDANGNGHSSSIDDNGFGSVPHSPRDAPTNMPTSEDDRNSRSQESQNSSGDDDSIHRGAISTNEDGIELTSITPVTESEDCGDVCETDGENICTQNCACSVQIKGCSIPYPGETVSSEEILCGIVDDTQDRDITCDICMLEFRVGDEIAWSPNVNCDHAFHKDCILEWLVRKPTCPICRQDYV